MKEWKDMNLWEKYGLIWLIIYFSVGVYTVTYNLMVWTLNSVEWILDKKTEWTAYCAGRKTPKEKSNEKEI